MDNDVSIGDNVKIHNYVSVYHGVALEDGVFVGPHVCFTNDMNPRAINPDGTLKAADDWVLVQADVTGVRLLLDWQPMVGLQEGLGRLKGWHGSERK